jgi:hypothetical protein
MTNIEARLMWIDSRLAKIEGLMHLHPVSFAAFIESLGPPEPAAMKSTDRKKANSNDGENQPTA